MPLFTNFARPVIERFGIFVDVCHWGKYAHNGDYSIKAFTIATNRCVPGLNLIHIYASSRLENPPLVSVMLR